MSGALEAPEPPRQLTRPVSPLLPLRLARLCELLAVERRAAGRFSEAEALAGEAAAYRHLGGIR